jgi:hypothetical protein
VHIPLGWVHHDLLECAGPDHTDNELACRVNDPTQLNIRSAPNGKTIGKLVDGTPVTILERKGNWVFVGLPASCEIKYADFTNAMICIKDGKRY